MTRRTRIARACARYSDRTPCYYATAQRPHALAHRRALLHTRDRSILTQPPAALFPQHAIKQTVNDEARGTAPRSCAHSSSTLAAHSFSRGFARPFLHPNQPRNPLSPDPYPAGSALIGSSFVFFLLGPVVTNNRGTTGATTGCTT